MRTITKWLIILLVVALPVLYVVVRSGFSNIPLVSGLLYREPTPVHTVASTGTLNQELQDQLTAFAVAHMTDSTVVGQPITITFSESAITAALRESLVASNTKMFLVDRAQVAAVEGQGLEVFLPLTRDNGRSAVTLQFNFDLEDGNLKPHVQKLKIGQLGIPSGPANFFVRESQKAWLTPLNDQLHAYFTLTAVEYTATSLRLQATLTKDLLQR